LSTKGAHIKVSLLISLAYGKIKRSMHCWKVEIHEVDEKDPETLQIKEFEGERPVEGKSVEMAVSNYGSSIKTNKYNIGTEEAPKMSIIGDY
jgi:hypothetical protein